MLRLKFPRLDQSRPSTIVPSKRNHGYIGGQPKKMKYDLELRFCQEVIKEITSSKHREINQYFTHPIDPVALNIPTYIQAIHTPMDFEDADITTCARRLEELFDKKWQRSQDWVDARQHTSDQSIDEGDEAEEHHSDRGHDKKEDIEGANQQDAEGTTSTPFQRPSLPFKLKFKCNGHGHSVAVKWEDCILDVKDKIEVDSGISAEGQSLFVNSRKVHDADMLRDLLTVAPYSVELRINLPKLVKFSVKTAAGNSVEMQLADTTTVARVKSMLQEKVGISTGQQLLVKEDVLLLDNEALHAFDIDNGDSLELHVRLLEAGCGCGQNSYVQGEGRAAKRNTVQDNDDEMDENSEDLATTNA